MDNTKKKKKKNILSEQFHNLEKSRKFSSDQQIFSILSKIFRNKVCQTYFAKQLENKGIQALYRGFILFSTVSTFNLSSLKIIETEVKLVPHTHIYMIAHFSGWVQGTSIKTENR